MGKHSDPPRGRHRKISQKSVDYRESSTARRRCGTCAMFRDGTCTLVAGKIEPDHVCDRWESRNGNK